MDSVDAVHLGAGNRGEFSNAPIALMLYSRGRDRPMIDRSLSTAVVSDHRSPAKVVAVDGMDDDTIRAAFPREKPGKSGSVRTRE